MINVPFLLVLVLLGTVSFRFSQSLSYPHCPPVSKIQSTAFQGTNTSSSAPNLYIGYSTSFPFNEHQWVTRGATLCNPQTQKCDTPHLRQVYKAMVKNITPSVFSPIAQLYGSQIACGYTILAPTPKAQGPTHIPVIDWVNGQCS
ncbi:hypothetical protein CleRT_13240 [Candidatus Coxiella mudrowiae]|uniref:Secreted protein n=1 Tax=Candidatus Coxiella mudrowiae TaxID=2054173 RepID=A0ABM5UV84_9COXI|nr:hypothetical protein CleRT_13240 [Candidatus Coxiella mudrowiae]